MPHQKQNIHFDVCEQTFDDENVFSAQEAGDYVIIHDLVDQIYDQQPQPQSFFSHTFESPQPQPLPQPQPQLLPQPHQHQTDSFINISQAIQLFRDIIEKMSKEIFRGINLPVKSGTLQCQCFNKYEEQLVSCNGKFCVYMKKQLLCLKKCSSGKYIMKPIFTKQVFQIKVLLQQWNTQKLKKNKKISMRY